MCVSSGGPYPIRPNQGHRVATADHGGGTPKPTRCKRGLTPPPRGLGDWEDRQVKGGGEPRHLLTGTRSGYFARIFADSTILCSGREETHGADGVVLEAPSACLPVPLSTPIPTPRPRALSWASGSRVPPARGRVRGGCLWILGAAVTAAQRGVRARARPDPTRPEPSRAAQLRAAQWGRGPSRRPASRGERSHPASGPP